MRSNSFRKISSIFATLAVLITTMPTFANTRLQDDLITIGKPGSSANKRIKLGSTQEIRTNSTTNKLEFAHDGSNFKPLGSGTGSGGSSGGINLITNESFEDPITTGWSNTGGTLTQETYSVAPSDSDTKYLRFVATTSGQYFETPLITVPTNFSGGCQADFKKISVADNDLFKIEILDSSSNVLSFGNVKKLNWQKFPTIGGACPAPGSQFRLRVTSLAAGTFNGDYAYLGSNQGMVQIGLSEIGEVITTSSASCPDGSIPADGAAVSRSQYNLLFSKIGITHGQGDGATTFNVPDYRGRFLRGVDGSANNDPDKASRAAMNAGGNTGNNVGSVQGDQFASHTHTDRWISVGGGGATGYGGQTGTIGSLSSGSTGGSETRPKNAFVNYCIRFKQISGDMGVLPEQSSWFIDANIGGGNVDMGTGTNLSTYTELYNGSLDLVINTSKGSAAAEIACQNGNYSTGLTCASGSESLGIAFIPPYTGVFEACFTVAPVVTGSGGASSIWQIIETPNNSTTILQEGGERIHKSYVSGSQDATPSSKVCGRFNFTDTSKKTIRLMREQVIAGSPTTHNLYADRSSSLGQRDINVTVRPWLSAYNRPYLTGDQVTRPGSSNIVEYDFVVDSAGGVVNLYGGNLVSSCTNASPHVCTFNASKFIGQVECFVNIKTAGTYSGQAHTTSFNGTSISAWNSTTGSSVNNISSKAVRCVGQKPN